MVKRTFGFFLFLQKAAYSLETAGHFVCVFFSVLFLSLRFSFLISFLVTSSLAVPFELHVNHENLVKSQIRQKLGSGAVTVLGTVISGSLF